MKDCVATHNHPGGLQFAENTWGRIGNSFSMEDIGLAIVSNLAEIRAVTPVYTFSLKRPANGWGVSYSEFTKGYKRLEKSVIKEIGQLINANKLSVEVSTATYYHLLRKMIAKIYMNNTVITGLFKINIAILYKNQKLLCNFLRY